MGKVRQGLCGLVVLGVALGGLSACEDGSAGAAPYDDEVVGQSESALWWGRRGGRWCPRPAKPSESEKDIVSTALAAGSFKTLSKALIDTDLVATLQGAGPFTVFAPTDAAFEALGADALAALTPEQLTTILKYHVVAGELTSSELEAGPVATASGLSAFVSLDNGAVKVNGATVTSADVEASNGVIHVIDKVLLPPNLVEAAQFAGSFASLLEAAGKAGLVDALSAPDANLTVFAPTDAAFAAIESTVAGLSVAELTDVLKYHVVPVAVLSSELKDGSVETLLTDKSVTISLDGDGVMVDDASVVVKDVVTTNGVIHVVDSVLIP